MRAEPSPPSTIEPHAAPASCDGLVVQYRPYVVKLARQLAETVPTHIELDDLIGWGHMGLVESARRFDATRGVTFRTFAHRRIRGAMIDGLRKEYTASAGVSATNAEAPSSVEVTCGDAAYRQDDLVRLGELRDRLASAMQTLTPLERTIVHHHYYGGQPVHLLSATTSLSKSWLSRVHSRALSKMRERILEAVDGVEAYL